MIRKFENKFRKHGSITKSLIIIIIIHKEPNHYLAINLKIVVRKNIFKPFDIIYNLYDNLLLLFHARINDWIIIWFNDADIDSNILFLKYTTKYFYTIESNHVHIGYLFVHRNNLCCTYKYQLSFSCILLRENCTYKYQLSFSYILLRENCTFAS